MDFEQAIAAHSAWKTRLSKYLLHPDNSLQPDDLNEHNGCELGKWICGEGQKFAHISEFATVKAHHARFHKIAAEIVRRANAGEKVSQEVVIGAKGEFGSAAAAVVLSLMALRPKVETPVHA
jgi:methyl-accepting chemotaxis protein